MKSIGLFGSTGSIGTSALEVIRKENEFRVKSLVFGKNLKLAEKQIEEFKPVFVGCIKKTDSEYLKNKYSFIEKNFYGEGISELAKSVKHDIFISAISGSAGLLPSLNALYSSKRIAIANKETFVMAGELFNKLSEEKSVEVIPVDSEHSAIFQCLKGENRNEVKEILLTASGGPFRNYPKEKFENITPKMALDHPNWDMGKKITIDSATLGNKSLELIEAVYLFNVNYDKVKIVIHPESIIHSMVKFNDNSIKAQLSIPDMKMPIQYALNYPYRKKSVIKDLDFFKLGSLNFEMVDYEKFPIVNLVKKVLKNGGLLPLVFNRINEEAVWAFLKGQIKFTEIYLYIEKYIDKYWVLKEENVKLDNILEVDNKLKKEFRKEL